MGEPVEIDVLVVCQHDAEMVRRCLTSCREGATNRVNLFVWINGDEDVARVAYDMAAPNVMVVNGNCGFIKPNNYLADMGSAPYLCLLNADTVCAPGWDVPLIDALTRPGTPVNSIVGYSGGWLSSDGIGRYAAFPGAPCDYVEGWCLMTTRAVWEALGGFDEANLTMAYGEDSDLCLRARERGWGVRAVANVATDHYGPLGDLATTTVGTHGEWVMHLRDVNGGQGKGASEETRRSPELAAALQANHAYIQQRHREYLASGRVLVKGYERPLCQTSTGCDETGVVILADRGRNIPHLVARELDGRLWELNLSGQRVTKMLLP